MLIRLPVGISEKECAICGKRSKLISNSIKVCVDCLRERPEESLRYPMKTHEEVRMKFKLPPNPPRSRDGVKCNLCSAECVMEDGEKSYCGLRENRYGKLFSRVERENALLHYYLDPHITNCCNAWFCPA